MLKTSLLPSSGSMKPKPLLALNHFTVPVAMSVSPSVNAEREISAFSAHIAISVDDMTAKRNRLTDEYDAAQERGEVASGRQ
jgi:hypothetical protein